MKTFITHNPIGKSFRTALAGFLVAIVLLVVSQSGTATAQTIFSADDSSIVSKASGGFQAAIHPVYNTLKMKVHVLNPKQDLVTVRIYNSDKEEVFKKRIGKNAIMHGSFDVTQMPNGVYTITVQSGKNAFSRSFSIETQSERIAKAL